MTFYYCDHCKKNVEGKVDISIPILVILLILGVVLGIIYLAYCYMSKAKVCPVCKFPLATPVVAAPTTATVVTPEPVETLQIIGFCSRCGAKIVTEGAFCPHCGAPLEGV